jgi:hypothetical protein
MLRGQRAEPRKGAMLGVAGPAVNPAKIAFDLKGLAQYNARFFNVVKRSPSCTRS